MSTASAPAGHTPRLWSHVQGGADWLLAGPVPQPDEIRNELIQQRTNKTKTLVVAVLAALLIASIAAALTGAAWAYAWLLAEIALGSTRIYIMMKAIATAKADRRVVPNITPVWAGLTSVCRIGNPAAGFDGRHRTCEFGRRHRLG